MKPPINLEEILNEVFDIDKLSKLYEEEITLEAALLEDVAIHRVKEAMRKAIQLALQIAADNAEIQYQQISPNSNLPLHPSIDKNSITSIYDLVIDL